jgi:hypothetical protein
MCIRAATGQGVAFQIYNLKTIALNFSKEKQGQLKKTTSYQTTNASGMPDSLLQKRERKTDGSGSGSYTVT